MILKWGNTILLNKVEIFLYYSSWASRDMFSFPNSNSYGNHKILSHLQF